MPDPTSAPNSPEARLKAQKIKNIFMLIAALNLALIAIAFWPGSTGKKKDVAPGNALSAPMPGLSAPAQKNPHEMELIFDSTLPGYDSLDSGKFLRFFSPTAQPAPTAAFFSDVIKGLYHHEFGAVVSKKLIPGETSSDPDNGMLVYETQCKKRPAVKLSVNFRREGGDLKIVQWRMEKL